MNDRDEKLHRTLVEVLMEQGQREAAALVLDGRVCVEGSMNGPDAIYVDVPPSSIAFLDVLPAISDVIVQATSRVAEGHLFDQNGYAFDNLEVRFRVLLVEPDEGWREKTRGLIVNLTGGNQATVTRLLQERHKRSPIRYNEMSFGSQSEVRIAQELERRKILFFPLPLAVRADSGRTFEDHREPDFLICENGVWGILEVSHHPDRFEKDAEKDLWFKTAGVLCIQHVTAERCYNKSETVVDEFLTVLRKHRR